jgi:hypothetical protein
MVSLASKARWELQENLPSLTTLNFLQGCRIDPMISLNLVASHVHLLSMDHGCPLPKVLGDGGLLQGDATFIAQEDRLEVQEVVGVGERIDKGEGINDFLVALNLDVIAPNHKHPIILLRTLDVDQDRVVWKATRQQKASCWVSIY